MGCAQPADRFGSAVLLDRLSFDDYRDEVKRGRRVGERRAQRKRVQAAHRADAQANDAKVRQRYAELDASVRATMPELSDGPLDGDFEVRLDAAVTRFEQTLKAKLGAANAGRRDGASVMAHAAQLIDRDALDAENAVQRAVEQLRAGQLSKTQRARLARVITARLGEIDLAIQDAKGACESTAHEVEEWTRRVSVALEHEEAELAAAARKRIEEWRSAMRATEAALQVYVELHDELMRLGHLLIETADRPSPTSLRPPSPT